MGRADWCSGLVWPAMPDAPAMPKLSPWLNMKGSNSMSAVLNWPDAVLVASGLGSNMKGENSRSSPLNWPDGVLLLGLFGLFGLFGL